MKKFFTGNQHVLTFALLVGVVDYFVVSILLPLVTVPVQIFYNTYKVGVMFFLYGGLLCVPLVYIVALYLVNRFVLPVSQHDLKRYFLSAWLCKVLIGLIVFFIMTLHDSWTLIVNIVQLVIAYVVGLMYRRHLEKKAGSSNISQPISKLKIGLILSIILNVALVGALVSGVQTIEENDDILMDENINYVETTYHAGVSIYVNSVEQTVVNLDNFFAEHNIPVTASANTVYMNEGKDATINFEMPIEFSGQLADFLSTQATDQTVYGSKTLFMFDASPNQLLQEMLPVTIVLTDVRLLESEQ